MRRTKFLALFDHERIPESSPYKGMSHMLPYLGSQSGKLNDARSLAEMIDADCGYFYGFYHFTCDEFMLLRAVFEEPMNMQIVKAVVHGKWPTTERGKCVYSFIEKCRYYCLDVHGHEMSDF